MPDRWLPWAFHFNRWAPFLRKERWAVFLDETEVECKNEDEQERMGQQLCCLYCDVLYVDVLYSMRYNKLGE